MSVPNIGELRAQLDACPTAHHVAQYVARRLFSADFQSIVDESSANTETGEIFSARRGFIVRNGAIVAWSIPSHSLGQGIRIVGAHTDSPGLHIKPRPDSTVAGWRQLAIEIYGSPLINSWLDRDLGIAGHVVLKNQRTHVFTHRSPIARVSQLAIHLDREVNERGLIIDKQQHLTPIWATTPGQTFLSWVAYKCAVEQDEIVSIDAQLFDVQPSSVLGLDETLLTSARLDNQVSCWAAIEALLQAGEKYPSFVILYDHEEVGSGTTTGAAGPFLEHVIERIAISAGIDRAGFLNILQQSHCVSVDNAHAIHPNYPERHDPLHAPIVNGGPVIKTNSNQRYATSSNAIGPFISACNARQIPTQHFVSRNNLACGSTIGPITATRLGIDTVDVGVAQLSMHSIREVCGVHDPIMMANALCAYFERC